jgi:signal transduction histidine kinase
MLRLGQSGKARLLVEQAYNIAVNVPSNPTLLAEILLSRGGIDGEQKNVTSALRDYQQAVKIFQKLKNYRSEAIGLIYIASLYTYAKDHQTAVRYLSQAEEVYSTDPHILISIKNNRGIEYAELGADKQAIEQFGDALSLAKKMNSSLLESQALRNTAYAQLGQNDLVSAAKTINQALLAAQRAGGQESPATISVAAQLALQRGRLDEARKLIEQSFAGVDLAKTSVPMREGHLTAYRIHRAVGNAEAALDHLEALKRLDDESTKLATQTSTALMGARFDFANQELRIARLKAEELRRSVLFEQDKARTQRLIFAGLAAVASVVLALLSFGLFTIRRSRDAVRAANADLGVTNDALGKALAARTEFLATTSHEIRTPLNGILGMTEVMLTDRALPDAARDRIRLVHGAGKTMRALVDDILDLAKIETGRLTIESEPFDLASVLRDAAMLWEDQVRAKGVAFTVDIDLPPTLVVGDGARVRQVVFNLLANAAKFTESGAIGLSAVRANDNVAISVRDSGVGIAPDKLELIFESFAQADASTTRRFGGTGLGLSISRDLARAMGGDLVVMSGEGQGSVFTFHLPVVDHVEERSASIAEVDSEALVIVDRNPIMRAMFRNLLAPHIGEVVVAGSLDEALVAIDHHRPCVVLVDDGVLTGGTDGLAIAAGACGATVTVLRTPGASSMIPGLFRVVEKPVTGSELIAAMFPDSDHRNDAAPLVSRAA